jgi:hypothetical protein
MPQSVDLLHKGLPEFLLELLHHCSFYISDHPEFMVLSWRGGTHGSHMVVTELVCIRNGQTPSSIWSAMCSRQYRSHGTRHCHATWHPSWTCWDLCLYGNMKVSNSSTVLLFISGDVRVPEHQHHHPVWMDSVSVMLKLNYVTLFSFVLMCLFHCTACGQILICYTYSCVIALHTGLIWILLTKYCLYQAASLILLWSSDPFIKHIILSFLGCVI